MAVDGSSAREFAALERRLLQRERQLRAVISVTQALQSQVELDALIRHAVLTTMATLEADAGSLLLHDAERHTLVFRQVEGPGKARITGMAIAETLGIAGEVFQSGRARISHDVCADEAHILDVDRVAEYQTRSMVTVPLTAATGERIGVLQVLNKHTGPFDEDDLAVAQVLATEVAAAIVTARLFEQAQAAAMVEMLGHLSHDIKNLLTPVLLAGQTLRMLIADFYQDLSCQVAQSDFRQEEVALRVTALCERIKADIAEVFNILEESTLIAQQRAREIADIVKGITTPPTDKMEDLNAVVVGVCRVLHLVAEQQGVTLAQEAGALPRAPLDAPRLYNAIYNLVNNAIAATPAGGRVTVRTAAHPGGAFPEGHYLQVEVIDTGCGMPSEIAATLFTRQVRSTRPGGTGLGTRVVHNIIAAHGGVLQVQSAPGVGTTITARLPMRDAAPAQAASRPEEHA